jgi:hypothetical protein
VADRFRSPPSSRGSSIRCRREAPRRLCQPSGKKPGGQKDYPGATRTRVEDPEHALRSRWSDAAHAGTTCRHCLSRNCRVSAYFVSPDFLRLSRANSPGLLHRRQSSPRGFTKRRASSAVRRLRSARSRRPNARKQGLPSEVQPPLGRLGGEEETAPAISWSDHDSEFQSFATRSTVREASLWNTAPSNKPGLGINIIGCQWLLPPARSDNRRQDACPAERWPFKVRVLIRPSE